MPQNEAFLRSQFPGMTDSERDEMLASLTEEERAGMLDPELEDGVGYVEPGEDEEDDDEDEDEPEVGAKTDDDEEEEEEEEPSPAEKAAEPPALDPADELPAVERMEGWAGPEDVDGKRKAFDDELAKIATDAQTKLAEISEKFNNGDLDTSEYILAMESAFDEKARLIEGVQKSQADLEEQVVKSALAFTTNREGFFRAAETFLKHNAVFAKENNPKLHQELDAEVRRLQVAPGVDPFDPAILVQARNNLAERVEAMTGEKPKWSKAPTKLKPTKRGDAPPNLGKLPAADPTETGGGRFSHLDNIRDGVEYEKALAALSDADRERYLASGR